MKKQQGYIVLDIIVLLAGLSICIGFIGGYIANIYKLIAHAPALAQWGIEQALRLVGIVASPLGAVLGYF